MNTIEIPIQKRNKRNLISRILRREQASLANKLTHPVTYVLLLISAVGIAFTVANFGLTAGLTIIALLIALPVVYCVVVFPQFGVITLLVAAYLIMFISRIGVPFPAGTLMDGLVMLLLLGFFIKQKSSPDWSIFKSPIGVIILIWIGYNVLEVFNPTATSTLAWLYTIRTVAMVMLTYFIFTYQIRSIQFIRLIIKIWLGLSVLAALYAFKQEFFGFFGFEERSNQIEGVPQLLFIANHWRKYSIFSDPVTFAYNMAAAGLLCAGLLTAPFKKVKKGLLLGVIVLVLTSMIFSGTRGAFPLVPAGLLLFAVLTFNKKTLMVIAITGVFTVGLILMPTSNQNILRFQSAFKPSNDASYQVREANQKKIKPFILSHPIGGGLGSTGEWGKRFSPNSYLSVFPPDSGYVRTTVELGFIGLIIFCILMFIILKTGIDNYYLIKNPELKSYCLAMVLMAFTWNIANFPQEALVQYPSNIIFSLTVALISVISKLDKQQTLLKENSTHTIAAK